jgi:hypothetical protein
MDLSFFRRAEQRFAGRRPARLDYGMLVATLRLQRESSRSEPADCEAPPTRRCADPLAEILLAGPAWRDAVAAQRGCFNPAFARQGAVN